MADTTFLKDNLKGSVPVEISNEVIKGIATGSVAMQVCRTTPMTSDTKVLPVLTDGGKAYWVNEGAKIGTTLNAWDYPQLEAKKLAVIIPVTKEKLADSVLNVMEEIKQGIADQFVKAIDSAIFFGTDTPFSTSIIGTMLPANKVPCTDVVAFPGAISEALGKVEEVDLIPTAIISGPATKKTIRNSKDLNGNALVTNTGVLTEGTIYQTPVHYLKVGAFDNEKAQILTGDFSRAVIGLRDSIEYTVLTEGTVGELNLGEQDLAAIKCTMRLGFNCVDGKAFSSVDKFTPAK